MASKQRGIESSPGRSTTILLLVCLTGLLASACRGDDSSTQAEPTVAQSVATTDVEVEPAAAQQSTTTAATTTAPEPQESVDTAAPGEPVLATPCFVTGAELALPAEGDWIAADVSSGAGDCLFVLQQDGLADTTVIAGELFRSSAGRSFEEFVRQVEEGLAVGQEPDILALQLLNSGASGRDLPIIERINIDGPNQAVILIHESDRRDGFSALSAVVDVPTESDPTITHAFKLWGLLLPPSVGEPQESPNYQLAIDLINSMEIEPQ